MAKAERRLYLESNRLQSNPEPGLSSSSEKKRDNVAMFLRGLEGEPFDGTRRVPRLYNADYLHDVYSQEVVSYLLGCRIGQALKQFLGEEGRNSKKIALGVVGVEGMNTLPWGDNPDDKIHLEKIEKIIKGPYSEQISELFSKLYLAFKSAQPLKEEDLAKGLRGLVRTVEKIVLTRAKLSTEGGRGTKHFAEGEDKGNSRKPRVPRLIFTGTALASTLAACAPLTEYLPSLESPTRKETPTLGITPSPTAEPTKTPTEVPSPTPVELPSDIKQHLTDLVQQLNEKLANEKHTLDETTFGLAQGADGMWNLVRIRENKQSKQKEIISVGEIKGENLVITLPQLDGGEEVELPVSQLNVDQNGYLYSERQQPDPDFIQLPISRFSENEEYVFTDFGNWVQNVWKATSDGLIHYNEAELLGGAVTLDPAQSERLWEDLWRSLYSLNIKTKNTAFKARYPTEEKFFESLKQGKPVYNLNIFERLTKYYPNVYLVVNPRTMFVEKAGQPLEPDIIFSSYEPTFQEILNIPRFKREFIDFGQPGYCIRFDVVQDSNGKYHLSIEFAKYVAYGEPQGYMLATIPTDNPEENLVPSQLQLVRQWLYFARVFTSEYYNPEGWLVVRGSRPLMTHRPEISFAWFDPGFLATISNFGDTTNSYFQLR